MQLQDFCNEAPGHTNDTAQEQMKRDKRTLKKQNRLWEANTIYKLA